MTADSDTILFAIQVITACTAIMEYQNLFRPALPPISKKSVCDICGHRGSEYRDTFEIEPGGRYGYRWTSDCYKREGYCNLYQKFILGA
jgi:hypothetical protein